MTTLAKAAAKDVAQYLRRYGALRIIGVLRVVEHDGQVRGKVNLGAAVCGNMRNNWLARPVERATSLGLLTATYTRGAYEYTLTDRGRAVLAAL